jgi:hypothetical protein
MGNHWVKHLVHGIAHGAKHERAHGSPGRAAALTMIGIGIVLLPIPIIGLPLLLAGIWKLFK